MTPLLCLLLMAAPPAHGGGVKRSAVLLRPSYGYAPQEGDIVLFRHRSVGMNLLVLASLSGWTTHVGMVVTRSDGRLALLESPAVGRRVTLNDIPTRLGMYDGWMWVRRRHIPLTPEQSARLTAFAAAQLGKPYDLLGFATLPVSLPVRVRRRPAPAAELNASRWFCASLVTAACVAADLLDASGVSPHGVCPDDLKSDLLLDLSGGWAKAVPCQP